MNTICVFGNLANGKDVLRDYLLEQLNKKEWDLRKKWHSASLADAVKNIFQDAFGVDRAFIEKWKRIDTPPPGMLKPVRQGLQFIGDGFREIVPTCWLDIIARDTRNIILADGRYLNEARYVKSIGGINIVLLRPGFESDDPNGSESQIRKITDKFTAINQKDGKVISDDPELSLFDLFIRNEGTIEDLYDKVDNIIIPYIIQQQLL